MEDAVELRIASKSGFERGVQHGAALAVSVEVKEPLDALAIAVVDKGKACLFVKEPAETACTESRFAGEVGKWAIGSAVTDEARGALNSGVNLLHGDVAGVLEALPGKEQGVGETGIEQRQVPGGGEIREKIPEALHILLREAAACISIDGGLQQGASWNIDGDAADHSAAEDSNPHTEIRGLLDEDMFLRGEKPEEIAASDFIAAIAEKVDAAAASDQIQFKFGMSMTAVCRGKIVVLPDAAIEFGRQMQMLAHDKKR
jgi:hypothetical protein